MSTTVGDSWEHLLEVESEHTRAVDAPRARVLDAARAAPPEDCGGIFQYEHLIQHLDDPEMVEEIPFDFPEDPDCIDTEDLDEAVQIALTRRLDIKSQAQREFHRRSLP